MKVLLIGKTEVDLFPYQGDSRHRMPGKAEGSAFERRVHNATQYTMGRGQNGQELIEFAGRLCYESFDLPNEDTKTNSKYVQSIVAKQHESVLEHVSVTFYVEGVSRSLSHELIRHRHLSFSELSQRYVNMEDARQVIPPAYREVADFPETVPLREEYREKYEYNVEVLRESGFGRKAAREAARSGLPNSTETKLVVSGNLRAWRDVLKKRYSASADAEIRIFARNVLEILDEHYPDVFADIEFGK